MNSTGQETARRRTFANISHPLQAIFDFDGQNIVDWQRDVKPDFVPLGTRETPHRWTHE